MSNLPKHISITAVSATKLVAIGHYGLIHQDGFTQVMYQASAIELPVGIVEQIDADALESDPDFAPLDIAEFYAAADGQTIEDILRLEGHDPSDPLFYEEQEQEGDIHALTRTRLILDDVRAERFRHEKENGPPLDSALYYSADLSAAAGVVSAAAKSCDIDHVIDEQGADRLTGTKEYRAALVHLAATAVAAIEALDQWGTHPGSELDDDTDERETEAPTT